MLVYGLLAVGVVFTIRLDFIQFVHFGEMFGAVRGSDASDKSGITRFQALCTRLASRVGTGNTAFVAVATSDPHHPSSQGFVQALDVFIDTILICTATAAMILLSGALVPDSGVTGTQRTQAAMQVHIGSGGS